MKIVVHIDRLVLEGLGQAPDLARLRTALEQELAQSLAAPAPGSREASTTPIDVSRGPEAIGRAIAQAAHARIADARAVGAAPGPPAQPVPAPRTPGGAEAGA